MAVLATTHPTLLDLAKATDPNGKIATVVELLNQTNEVLDDMVWQEGNLPTGHRTTVRTGIPAPTWRKYYGGVQPTKSETAQVTDNCGMLEAYAEIDKALADLNGNKASYMLSQQMAFLEGINQTLASTIFYGSEVTTPESFTGLSPRYATTAGTANAENIIKAGGAGSDNASIWLVVWGPNTMHGIIPKGSTAGIQVTDKGQVTIEDIGGNTNAGRMEAYRTHYRLDSGLCVPDWRYAVRIANIDKSDLTAVFNAGTFATGANLPDLMFQAMRRIPNLNAGRPAFYMSRDVASWVARQRAAMGNANYVDANSVRGDMRWAESFSGIPMRRVDVLAADEALVP